jgi:hypothetical protein
MNKRNLSVCLLSACAFGAAATAQTLLNPAYDADIVPVVVNGIDIYEVQGPLSVAANAEVVIDRPMFVTGGSLTIGEGAVLRFDSDAYLVISRDGTIDAVGTATNPIIMTSAAGVDVNGDPDLNINGPTYWDANPKTAPMKISEPQHLNQWGGFIMLGNAPLNVGDRATGIMGIDIIEGVGSIDGERVYYGGINPHDNSGRVRYLSIRYSGQVLGEGDEIQGLTVGGLGSGTELSFIEVYGSGDDGIEVFGGTVNMDHIVMSWMNDDGFDVDQGYVGIAQFGLVIASQSAHPDLSTDNLFEFDGDDDIEADDNNVSADGRPFQYTQIYNWTLIGHDSVRGSGMRLRQGFGGDIVNTIVANLPTQAGLRIDSSGTGNAALAGYPSANSRDRAVAGTLNLISTSWYGVNNPGHATFDDDVLANTVGLSRNNVIGALADARFGNNNPAFGGVTGEPLNPVPFTSAVELNVSPLPNNPVFQAAPYRGAFQRAPNAPLWTNGWTAINTIEIAPGQPYFVSKGTN